MINIQNLVQTINNVYWNTGNNRDSLLEFYSNIEALGKKRFMVAYMKEFTMRDVVSLFLNIQEIWSDFTVDDWLELMQMVGDRPPYAPKGQIGDLGVYSDLNLLCKYLEIDGLDLYLNYSQVPKKTKLSVLTYLKGFVEEFIKESFEEEYLSDNKTTLDNQRVIKKYLSHDSRVRKFPNDDKSVKDYIDKLYTQYRVSL